MSDNQTIVSKMEKLETLCPGVHFNRNIDTIITTGILRFEQPMSSGVGYRPYTVDLNQLGTSLEEWLDTELERHFVPEGVNDDLYYVICYVCGRQKIGFNGYIGQMTAAHYGWICPKCGGQAIFDDDTYEAGFSGEEGDNECPT